MAPNYKNAGNWIAIPEEAIWGTYHGTYEVLRPVTTEETGSGVPCGAFGKPRIRISTPRMDDAGMAFWRGFFASVDATSASISIEARDPRTGVTEKWVGLLKWPTYDSVSWGSSAAKTAYRNVRIEITECVATT
jgi:hypothetical protein